MIVPCFLSEGKAKCTLHVFDWTLLPLRPLTHTNTRLTIQEGL